MELDKIYHYSCLEELILKNAHKHIQFIRHDFIGAVPIDLISTQMLEGVCKTNFATYLIINTHCTIIVIVAPKWLITQNEEFQNNISRELNKIIKQNGR